MDWECTESYWKQSQRRSNEASAKLAESVAQGM